jgi:ADP-dependent NAD(P)H-hydrate dehydratase / NAD(P)H-hydrate epimerase
MKVLTAAEMRDVDRLSIERHGIPSLQLMETAGSRVAEVFRDVAERAGLQPRTIYVLCGKGNNGGDGFVAARLLRSAFEWVRVILFAQPEELRGDAAANFQRWREMGGEVVVATDENAWQDVSSKVLGADAVVDAIFGTGFRGVAPGVIERAIQEINHFSHEVTSTWLPLILAVDTPSGLPADGQAAEGPVLRAHHTVTFTAPKVGQLVSRDAAAVGALRVVNIGSPNALVEEVGKGSLRWIEPEEFADMALVRRSDGHKGLYGHILVVAGSQGKSGAAVMAGYAALRSGAGLVTTATPDVVLPIVAAAHPEAMTESLLSTDAGMVSRENLAGGRFSRILEGKSVLAVGPGLGQEAETQEFVRTIVKQAEVPIVLDADGLNAFAGQADELRDRKSEFLAVTPHPGEMSRLFGRSTKDVQEDRVKTAQDAAKRWNAHVILKGAHTIIAAPDGRTFVNTTGNAGLAKGGSGDVLTGILAALTGQFGTGDWLQVLALGVYLHGAAADLAVAGTDPSGLLASEVAAAVPAARRKLLRELQRRG